MFKNGFFLSLLVICLLIFFIEKKTFGGLGVEKAFGNCTRTSCYVNVCEFDMLETC